MALACPPSDLGHGRAGHGRGGGRGRRGRAWSASPVPSARPWRTRPIRCATLPEPAGSPSSRRADERPEPVGVPPLAHDTGRAAVNSPRFMRESPPTALSPRSGGVRWAGTRSHARRGAWTRCGPGIGEPAPLSAKRARLPRAGDFQIPGRAAEARLSLVNGWEVSVRDAGVLVGRGTGSGRWRGQQVGAAGESLPRSMPYCGVSARPWRTMRAVAPGFAHGTGSPPGESGFMRERYPCPPRVVNPGKGEHRRGQG